MTDKPFICKNLRCAVGVGGSGFLLHQGLAIFGLCVGLRQGDGSGRRQAVRVLAGLLLGLPVNKKKGDMLW